MISVGHYKTKEKCYVDSIGVWNHVIANNQEAEYIALKHPVCISIHQIPQGTMQGSISNHWLSMTGGCKVFVEYWIRTNSEGHIDMSHTLFSLLRTIMHYATKTMIIL